MAVHRGEDFSRVFTLTAEWGCSPGRCIHGESPPRGGADGEGAERPLSCLDVALKTFLAGSPPPPGRYRGLLPPPPEGAGKCLAIDPDTVSGEQERDSGVSVHTDGRERISPGRCIHGESPPRGGADGEGAERPFPCLGMSSKTSLAGSPPPPGRSAASSRPLNGGGQCMAIVRIPCQGRETGFQQGVHVDGRERIFSPWHCIYGESPPRGGADGEGAERPFPCLDVALKTSLAGSPPLLSPVSLVERFTWITPTARPLRGLLPPPARGGWQSVAIVRIQRQGRGFQQGVHVDGRERIFSPWHCIHGESPPWGGADGEAETAPPSPVAASQPQPHATASCRLRPGQRIGGGAEERTREKTAIYAGKWNFFGKGLRPGPAASVFLPAHPEPATRAARTSAAAPSPASQAT